MHEEDEQTENNKKRSINDSERQSTRRHARSMNERREAKEKRKHMVDMFTTH